MRQHNAQFPLGLAPFTRLNLVAYAFLTSFEIFTQPLGGTYGLANVVFPSGIIAAGIAGAISLRRTNQSKAIPRLLLTTLILTLVCALIGMGIIQYNATLDFPNYRNICSLTIFVIDLLIALLFAGWIARRQQPMYKRWLELDGTPVRKNQGGCLSAFLWLALMNVVSFLLILVFHLTAVPALSMAFAPPTQYAASGVSLTAPAGWVKVLPAEYDIGCDAVFLICIAHLQQPTTDSRAVFVSIRGSDPSASIRTLSGSMISRVPGTPTPKLTTYAPASLAGHPGVTTSFTMNGVSEVMTAFINGDNIISVLFECPRLPLQNCEAMRDQFMDTLQFVTPQT